MAALLMVGGVMNAYSQECNTNSSISHESVKAGNYKDAYLPWKEVMKDCPTLRYYTYTDGFDILKYFLGTVEKTTPEYQAYFDELMGVHDQLMKYTPEMQQTVRGIRSVARSLGMKALDYEQFAPKPDPNVVYEWFKESVNAEQSNSLSAILFYFLQASANKLQVDPAHQETFIQDYLSATQWVEEAIEKNAEKPDAKQGYETVKENLVALFINSGAADCASLQKIYAPKVEENKTDLEYLKKVIDIMKMMRCTEEEAYFQASLYSYQIQPTADAAAGCAYMSFKKGDIDATVRFFNEAIDLETDVAKQAESAYKAAVVLSSVKKLSQARTYAQKAISLNPNYGAPYILIAKLYASSPNWSDESALNKCTYFVVIDKLQRAKAVDSSQEVQDEVNSLIRTYAQHTPAASDLFMLGYKVGDRVTVGGWIGETTTIR